MVRKNEQHETKSSTVDRSNLKEDAEKDERALWAARKVRQMPCSAVLPPDHDSLGVHASGKRSTDSSDDDLSGSKRTKREKSKKTKKEKKEKKEKKKKKRVK